MEKNEFEEYLNLALSTGADFAEIFYEKARITTYRLSNSQLDTINNEKSLGLGIRILKDEECYYTSTNNLDKANIQRMIKNLLLNFNKTSLRTIKLNNIVDKTTNVKIPHDEFPIDKKKNLLKKIDKIAREYSKLVTQVSAGILENNRDFIIANSNGNYIKSNYCNTRIMTSVYVEF